MAQKDSFNIILMTHRKVNLLCDGQPVQLRYTIVDGRNCAQWFMNGKNTELQVTALIKMLREKYKSIKVTWKRLW